MVLILYLLMIQAFRINLVLMWMALRSSQYSFCSRHGVSNSYQSSILPSISRIKSTCLKERSFFCFKISVEVSSCSGVIFSIFPMFRILRVSLYICIRLDWSLIQIRTDLMSSFCEECQTYHCPKLVNGRVLFETCEHKIIEELEESPTQLLIHYPATSLNQAFQDQPASILSINHDLSEAHDSFFRREPIIAQHKTHSISKPITSKSPKPIRSNSPPTFIPINHPSFYTQPLDQPSHSLSQKNKIQSAKNSQWAHKQRALSIVKEHDQRSEVSGYDHHQHQPHQNYSKLVQTRQINVNKKEYRFKDIFKNYIENDVIKAKDQNVCWCL